MDINATKDVGVTESSDSQESLKSNNAFIPSSGSSVLHSKIADVENMQKNISDEQLKYFKTDSSVFVILNTKLRAQQKYTIGDGRLYSDLIEASRYIQIMCTKSLEGQNAIRSSGVLNTLIETFVSFYANHLEDHTNPIIHERLIKCWSNICTAIYETVNDPINKRNQELVIGKIIEKHDLKIIKFVVTTSKSVDKQTENYVIPIILIFKALVIDNDLAKELIISRKYFILDLAEGLLARLQSPNHDPTLWKSIDLMAWLLSLILQGEKKKQSIKRKNDDSEKSLSIFSPLSTTEVDCALLELVIPSIFFLEKDRIAEKPPSIGILMLFASMLARNLSTVQRFLSAGGEVTLSQIFSSQPPISVSNATKLTFQVLNIQKRRLRESGSDHKDNDAQSNFSSGFHAVKFGDQEFHSSQPQSVPALLNLAKPRTPTQEVPSVNPISGLDRSQYIRTWIDSIHLKIEQDQASRSSSGGTGSSAIPPPPPASEVETSISRYREPSLMSYPFPSQTDSILCSHCNAGNECSASSKELNLPCNFPKLFEAGGQNHLTGATATNITKTKEVDENGPPPNKRPRETLNQQPDWCAKSVCSDNYDSRASMISINIARKKLQSSNNSKNESDVEKMSNDEISKIFQDMRPCQFMETNDHIVVLCTPPKEIESSVVDKEVALIQSLPRPTKPTANVKENSRRSSILGNIFRWLFN